jgi:NTE family protein
MKTKAEERQTSRRASRNRIALVLQGGGALGAYQAGVFQALHEHDLTPDWIVGTSIGAINAAIIAGNPPEKRVSQLKEFWNRISQSDSYDMNKMIDAARKFNTWVSTANAVTRGVDGFFLPRLFSPFASGLAVAPEDASYYDTTELAVTLKDLIDFDYLNAPGGVRLTVNAVKVTRGELFSFDSLQQTLGVEHIMASGALPPGFPPIRIDGELYWDGGLYSNTPLETVLDDQPPVDTLCFMVDLWSADGPEPTTLDEVQTRQKDIMFASRSKRHIEAFVRTHNLQRIVRTLYDKLPAKLKSEAGEDVLAALGCDTVMHVVRLEYGGHDWHMAAKDINFSKGSIEWRWEQGYRDASRSIQEAGWLATVTDQSGIVVHELAPHPAQ